MGEIDVPDEVIELALKKSNMNLEQSILLVTNEAEINELQAELVKEQEV